MPLNIVLAGAKSLKPAELLQLLAASVATMTLSTMDQCTRGPSLTAMLITNAPALLC